MSTGGASNDHRDTCQGCATLATEDHLVGATPCPRGVPLPGRLALITGSASCDYGGLTRPSGQQRIQRKRKNRGAYRVTGANAERRRVNRRKIFASATGVAMVLSGAVALVPAAASAAPTGAQST